MEKIERIVVVGAGQAGASAVGKLRSLGFDGTVSLVGRENELPYQRPPLTKKYLLGELDAERLLIKPRSFYEQHAINLHLGVEAKAIDRQRRTLALSNGHELAWDRLLLSTGTRPRQLPASLVGELTNVHTIRTRNHVDHLTPVISGAKSALIVGGGYIGLEVAAVVRQLGIATTLVEAGDRILQRVAAVQTSRLFADLHRTNGVVIHEVTGLETLEPCAQNRCRAKLSNGEQLDVDIVLVGIGVEAETHLAEAAGLGIANGIEVDDHCRTSDENIFAAGDCTSFPWRGRRLRLESVQNAIEQAEAAAANMLGHATPYDPVPWFWSDQYDVKLQIAGLSQGYDQVIERPGSRQGAASVWYFAGDRLLAVDAFNDAAAYMTAKRLLEAGRSPPVSMLSDPAVALKSLLSEN